MDPKKYYSIIMHTVVQQFRAKTKAPAIENPTWYGLPRGVDMAQEIPVWTWVDDRAVWLAVFTAEEEQESMARHFRGCGWKNDEIAKLRNFAWFSAKVDMHCIPLDGVEISPIKGDPELVQHVGTTYLGACCYKTVKEFIDVEYRVDYLLDLMCEAVDENLTKLDATILAPVQAWFKDQRELRYAAQQAHNAAKTDPKKGKSS